MRFRIYGFLVCVLFLFSCSTDDSVNASNGSNDATSNTPANSLSISRDNEFIDLFTRYGDGWTGGDATYSILLPDGRTLWLFGDTFLGTVNPDRVRPPGWQFARNTFVVQDGEDLTTLVKPNGSNFVSPDEPGWWYWPTDGTIYNDTLQVILPAFRSTGGGSFGFEYAAIDLALFKLPEIELISKERLFTEPNIAFGSCVVEDSDYIYIYGAERTQPLGKQSNIARAANGDLRNVWEYFNGTEWVADISKAQGIVSDVSEQFAVFKEDDMYYMVTHDFIFGCEIYLWESPNPEGPWDNQRTIYCTPETVANIFTYNSFVHPQFSENGDLLISYNTNSFNFSDILSNADNYRPYFIRVSNWK
tara:strand:- start:2496 stop:3578 length:1083 start_codon:yes stop_codon:yes gene_type:complete